MPHALAIDAGGTSTRAVVVDATGRCRGYGRAGGGNPVSWDPGAAADALAEAAREALASASLRAEEIDGVVVAMAGGRTHQPQDGTEDRDTTSGLVAGGLRGPFTFESDLLATYFSGTHEPDGYAMVAGTGAAAIRVRGGRVEKVADGMGWLVGDSGSGFWIGREVVRAVVTALDERGPATALTALLLDAAGVEAGIERGAEGHPTALRRLVDVLYSVRPVRLAQFAPLAFAVPEDETAGRILRLAADSLGGTLDAVLAHDVDGPLVLGGSVLLRQKTMRDAIETSLRERDRPMPVRLVADGTAGAAVLALRHGGVPVDATVLARIGESLDRLR